jgi:UDP:flavonoid glycosyltransferase YjiC (YdhE family)
MSRILVASEFGQGYGSVSAVLGSALALRKRGMHIVFAVRDLASADRFLARHGIPAVQAPLWLSEGIAFKRPASYVDILFRLGYGDASLLEGLVVAWRTLFEELSPDLLLVEHSPTALMAARGRRMRRVLLGNGFSLPPKATPLPPLPSDESVSLSALVEAEQKLVDTINAILKVNDAPSIKSLADLWESDREFLCTFPELDHYPRGSSARYWGPGFVDHEGAPPSWSRQDHPRIFAYLVPTHPQFYSLLDALTTLSCPVLIHAPGANPSIVRRHRSQDLKVLGEPVHMARVLEETDLVICHAGHGTSAIALLSGRPLLMLPLHAEQLINATNIARYGAGETITAGSPTASLRRQLRAALENASYTERAEAFAQQYRDYRQEDQIRAIAAVCAELLA